MPQLSQGLGYGKIGILETETNSKLLKNDVLDIEEVRRDFSGAYPTGYGYIGVALSGAPTSSNMWYVIRKSYVQGLLTRIQFQIDIAWDNRFFGWPA